jgi:hypothetical protein
MDFHQMWVDLNRPSPEKFRLALQRKGLVSPPVAQLRELFYKYQSSKQIFAPPPKYTGRIYFPIHIPVGRLTGSISSSSLRNNTSMC